MSRDKGQRLASVISEEGLSEKLESEPTLDRAIQGRIGAHLRAMYDELVSQPVPDRFVELIGSLDKPGRSSP
jgi:hypothetical protein